MLFLLLYGLSVAGLLGIEIGAAAGFLAGFRLAVPSGNTYSQ